MKFKVVILLISLSVSSAVLGNHTVSHNAEKIDRNSNRITSNDDETRHLDAGVALSNALSAHQYDFNHNGLQAGVAAGGFRGESGISLGFAVKPSENTLFNMQGGVSSKGDEGASVSFGIKF